MSINLEELEALAKQATPGPYILEHDDADYHALHSQKGYEWVCNIEHFGSARFFQKLDPDTILALVRAVRAAHQLIHFSMRDQSANLTDGFEALRIALEPFTTEDRA